MKKKGVIAAVVVLIAVAAGAYLLTRHKPLGSMRNSFWYRNSYRYIQCLERRERSVPVVLHVIQTVLCLKTA